MAATAINEKAATGSGSKSGIAVSGAGGDVRTEYVVRARDVVKEFKMGNETVRALKGISLDIRRGEYISIMGPSGSGKSTFFNMIGGIDRPNSGSIFIADSDIAQLGESEMAFLRCHNIGYIFQSYNLLTTMTALENVQLPTIFAGMPAEEGTIRAMEILERVGLGHRLHNKPSQLSGGQQQRVAIARSLANRPSIVLADEPTANLDAKTGKEIIGLLRELNKEEGVTIISATHDPRMLDVSDRVVWVNDGMIDRVENRENIEIRLSSVDDDGH